MATTVAGIIIENRVVFKEDIKSRKKAFASVDAYKKKLQGIKTQMTGLGNIKIKVDGLKEAKSQLSQIKAQASKVSAANVKAGATPKATGAPRSTKNPQTDAIKEQIRQERLLARVIKFENSPAMQKLSKEQREYITDQLKKIKNETKMGVAISNHQRKLRNVSNAQRDLIRQQNKLNFAQERGLSSMKQMAGAAFSVYTAYAGIASVTRVGMDFQKIEASLLSVSSSTKEAKDNMKFVRAETLRLGGDLVQNAKAFAKLLASKGGMNLSQVKEIYTGVSEMAATRGLTADEVSGSINALNQMAGKTKVQAEELRQQLAERLPGSVALFAQAAKDAGLTVNGTVSELEDLMRDGKALAEKILPKAAQAMSSASKKSLGMALQNLSVQLSRAKTNFDIFQGSLFDKGVESGIKVLLEGFYELMRSSEVIASFLGGAFKGAILALVTPFRLVHAAIHDLVVFFGGEWSESSRDFIKDIVASTGAVIAFGGSIYAVIKGFKLLSKAKAAAKATIGEFLDKGKTDNKSTGYSKGMGKRVFVTNMPKGGMGGVDTSGSTKGGKTTGGKLGKAVEGLALIPLVASQLSIQGDQNSNLERMIRSQGVAQEGTVAGYLGAAYKNMQFMNKPTSMVSGGAMQHANQQPTKIQVELVTDNDIFSLKVRDEIGSTFDGMYQ